MTTQNRKVLNWLQSGASLTAQQSADYFGIYRLSARIYDLKEQGYAIESKLQFEGSKHWSIYTLNLKP